jgi:DNA-binding Lrp family transcriptional regulator
LVETISATDLRLIRCLQDDPRASYATIARRLEMSETTVRRRVEGLINSKTITPALIFDFSSFGYNSAAVIQVRVDAACLTSAAQQLSEFTEIAWVGLSLGQYNVVAFVMERTIDDLMQFTIDRIATIEGVRDYEVAVIPRFLKYFSDWRVATVDAGASEGA